MDCFSPVTLLWVRLPPGGATPTAGSDYSYAAPTGTLVTTRSELTVAN